MRFIKDFNFSPLPSRFSLRTDFERFYNELKLRNVYADRDILIDSTVSKDFVWNRAYELNWDLTRSLKFDFSINNRSRIDEQPGAYDLFRQGDNSEWSSSVWKSIRNRGRPVNYNHNLNATYNLPLNKFPIISWTSVSLRYNSTYDWTQGPVFEGSRTLGNTINNSNTIQVNTTFNLTGLYNKSKYLKRLETKYSGRQTTANAAPKKTKTLPSPRKMSFFGRTLPRNISHKLKSEDVKVKVTNSNGDGSHRQTFAVLDQNRISITADTNYTGLQVNIEGEVETANPVVISG